MLGSEWTHGLDAEVGNGRSTCDLKTKLKQARFPLVKLNAEENRREGADIYDAYAGFVRPGGQAALIPQRIGHSQ